MFGWKEDLDAFLSPSEYFESDDDDGIDRSYLLPRILWSWIIVSSSSNENLPLFISGLK